MTSNLDRTRTEIDKLLTESTVVHAVVGAGDLAIAKLRETRAELSARTNSFEPRHAREQAQAAVRSRLSSVPADVRSAPQTIKALPDKAQSALAEAVGTAFSAYGELADRGRTIVERLFHSPSADDQATSEDAWVDAAAPASDDQLVADGESKGEEQPDLQAMYASVTGDESEPGSVISNESAFGSVIVAEHTAEVESLPEVESPSDVESLSEVESPSDVDSLPEVESPSDVDSLPEVESSSDVDSLPEDEWSIQGESLVADEPAKDPTEQ